MRTDYPNNVRVFTAHFEFFNNLWESRYPGGQHKIISCFETMPTNDCILVLC